jgi:hypothetical protein
VRAHCGVSDTDSREAMRDAVGRTVRDHALAADAVGWLLRLIGVVDDATARFYRRGSDHRKDGQAVGF